MPVGCECGFFWYGRTVREEVTRDEVRRRIAWAGPVRPARSVNRAPAAKPPQFSMYLFYYRARCKTLVRKVVSVARIVCESPAFDVFSGFHTQRRLVRRHRLGVFSMRDGQGTVSNRPQGGSVSDGRNEPPARVRERIEAPDLAATRLG
jgi:hypothetical protein